MLDLSDAPEGTSSSQQGAVTPLMCPRSQCSRWPLGSSRRSISSPLNPRRSCWRAAVGVTWPGSEVRSQLSSGEVVLIKLCLHLCLISISQLDFKRRRLKDERTAGHSHVLWVTNLTKWSLDIPAERKQSVPTRQSRDVALLLCGLSEKVVLVNKKKRDPDPTSLSCPNFWLVIFPLAVFCVKTTDFTVTYFAPRLCVTKWKKIK